jgi:hypothetical protein
MSCPVVVNVQVICEIAPSTGFSHITKVIV